MSLLSIGNDLSSGNFGSLIDDAFALIAPSFRMIGFIMPDVTVEENHHDELVITDHPVETGAMISDHAFKRPVEVEMRCGWSNSTVGFVGYVQLVYEALQALQNSRIPFDVFTGKRVYSNMLIRSLSITTDPTSEYALLVTAGLREVIITSTETTNTSGDTAGGAPQSAQADPASTAGTQNGGHEMLKAAPVEQITSSPLPPIS
ncbi:phage baseplate protein [Labrys neptuniae]